MKMDSRVCGKDGQRGAALFRDRFPSAWERQTKRGALLVARGLVPRLFAAGIRLAGIRGKVYLPHAQEKRMERDLSVRRGGLCPASAMRAIVINGRCWKRRIPSCAGKTLCPVQPAGSLSVTPAEAGVQGVARVKSPIDVWQSRCDCKRRKMDSAPPRGGELSRE